MNFMKTVLATVVGFFIAVAIVFSLLIASVSAIGMAEDKVSVKKNSILEIDLESHVNDAAQKTIIEDFDFEDQDYNGLSLIIKSIEHAKNDDKIKGISIKTATGIVGYAQLKELHDALTDFKTSGKFVYAFSNSYLLSQKDYYLYSLADSLFVGPGTEIQLQGLSANIRYYKDFQEKIGVKMEVFRHGKYKSAVEPYLENKMSESNKEQITQMLLSVWDNYVSVIEKNRNISKEKLNLIADSLWTRTPELALQHKIIDGIRYQDEFEELLCQATETEKVKDLEFVSIQKYAEYVSQVLKEKKSHKDKIAIIYAEGTIMSGKSGRDVMGDETIIEALREARDDQDVKAIILRVNSPGGSGLASEMIHREIELTQKQKPVYTSMGNVAASGGYYIACNSKRIFADAETITGSIGVFMTVPNFKELADRVGISNEQVTTHTYSGGYYRGYNPLETTNEHTAKLLTQGIKEFYDKFIQRVADGRKMSKEDVHQVAQGRVWIGTDALKNGLVDQIASLKEVVDYVAKQHELNEYSIHSYPTIKITLKDLFADKLSFSTHFKQMIEDEIGKENYEAFQRIKQLNQIQGIQARLMYDIEIK